MWLGLSLGISLAISFMVPFPYSLVIIIGVFILLNFYMRKRMMGNVASMGPPPARNHGPDILFVARG